MGLKRALSECGETLEVAVPMGCPKHLEAHKLRHSVERGLYSHATSSLGSGLNTHMVTDDDIITVGINSDNLK